MIVAELIRQLKELSAGERETVARLFRELETPTVPVAGNSIGTSASGSGNWPDFGARLKRIYGSKVIADGEVEVTLKWTIRGSWLMSSTGKSGAKSWLPFAPVATKPPS